MDQDPLTTPKSMGSKRRREGGLGASAPRGRPHGQFGP